MIRAVIQLTFRFAILLNRARDLSDALAAVTRIKDRLLVPFVVADREIRMTASIGIALGSGRREINSEDVLREADEAMYRDKVSVHGPRKPWTDPPTDQPGSGRARSAAEPPPSDS